MDKSNQDDNKKKQDKIRELLNEGKFVKYDNVDINDESIFELTDEEKRAKEYFWKCVDAGIPFSWKWESNNKNEINKCQNCQKELVLKDCDYCPYCGIKVLNISK